jgi:site-specific DNA-methyltransferase (adenine-specific)
MTHRIEHLAEGVTLHLGDCREILPTIEGVDLVMTDPPYSDNTHAMAKTNKGAGHGTKLVTFGALSDADFVAVAEACLAASGGWLVMTCDYRHAALLYSDKRFVRLGVWVKPNPMPQISADRPGQGFETVAILHSGKRPKAWNRGGGSGVWTYPVMNGAEVPTQKPLPLLSSLVSDFSMPGELIADPFMGSGTTGVAAVKSGRHFVGIEANETHFDVARKRISDALRRPDLFVAQRCAVVQEAFL